jgi:FMN phosphatase YigB (HAD superfamily)
MACPETLALVLDAMGVIYRVADDVADLLCPYIAECGGETDRAKIDALYRAASLGGIAPAEFWRAVNVDPATEDIYLQRLELLPGALEFLSLPPPEVCGIWCLSNDLGDWSRKVRERFGLEAFVRDFFISGDLGIRKPDEAVFRRVLDETGLEPSRVLFVDDREANLDPARRLGMHTVQFAPPGTPSSGSHPAVADFDHLRRYIADLSLSLRTSCK